MNRTHMLATMISIILFGVIVTNPWHAAFSNENTNLYTATLIVKGGTVEKEIAELSEEDKYAVRRLYLADLDLEDISFISRFLSIWEVALDGNRLTDISPLSHCMELQVLTLADNRVSDLSPLYFCKLMRVLDLQNNEISDISFLAMLGSLEKLNLGGNPRLRNITVLGSLRKLKELSLQNCDIENIWALRGLRSLQYLDVSNNPIIDYTPVSFLMNLRHLRVTKNAIDPASLEWIKKQLPDCTIELLEISQDHNPTQVPYQAPPVICAANGETLTLEGTGDVPIQELTANHGPYRVTVEGNASVLVAEESPWRSVSSLENRACSTYARGGAGYFGYVESDGAWKLTLEPLKDGGSIPLSGTGSYVSDFFPLEKPLTVTISANAANAGTKLANVMINLVYPYFDADEETPEVYANMAINRFLLTDHLTFSTEVTLEPEENQERYFWEINVPPGVAWSIEAKESAGSE